MPDCRRLDTGITKTEKRADRRKLHVRPLFFRSVVKRQFLKPEGQDIYFCQVKSSSFSDRPVPPLQISGNFLLA